jgi:hypothetical protein
LSKRAAAASTSLRVIGASAELSFERRLVRRAAVFLAGGMACSPCVLERLRSVRWRAEGSGAAELAYARERIKRKVMGASVQTASVFASAFCRVRRRFDHL